MYPRESYHCMQEQMPDGTEIVRLAEWVYSQVFRTNFAAPGFALLSFRHHVDSICLRRFMIALKAGLDATYRKKSSGYLHSLSMLRFDQQNTTKFHLDGAPDESFLMLGYEPSGVQSVLHMADYTRAAHDLKITPQQFLTDYNPLFAHGEQQLLPYATRVEGFDTHGSHVLMVNNSRLPFCPDGANVLGVMHQATILAPDPTLSRIVNSIMLAVSNAEDEEATGLAMQQGFLTV